MSRKSKRILFVYCLALLVANVGFAQDNAQTKVGGSEISEQIARAKKESAIERYLAADSLALVVHDTEFKTYKKELYTDALSALIQLLASDGKAEVESGDFRSVFDKAYQGAAVIDSRNFVDMPGVDRSWVEEQMPFFEAVLEARAADDDATVLKKVFSLAATLDKRVQGGGVEVDKAAAFYAKSIRIAKDRLATTVPVRSSSLTKGVVSTPSTQYRKIDAFAYQVIGEVGKFASRLRPGGNTEGSLADIGIDLVRLAGPRETDHQALESIEDALVSVSAAVRRTRGQGDDRTLASHLNSLAHLDFLAHVNSLASGGDASKVEIRRKSLRRRQLGVRAIGALGLNAPQTSRATLLEIAGVPADLTEDNLQEFDFELAELAATQLARVCSRRLEHAVETLYEALHAYNHGYDEEARERVEVEAWAAEIMVTTGVIFARHSYEVQQVLESDDAAFDGVGMELAEQRREERARELVRSIREELQLVLERDESRTIVRAAMEGLIPMGRLAIGAKDAAVGMIEQGVGSPRPYDPNAEDAAILLSHIYEGDGDTEAQEAMAESAASILRRNAKNGVSHELVEAISRFGTRCKAVPDFRALIGLAEPEDMELPDREAGRWSYGNSQQNKLFAARYVHYICSADQLVQAADDVMAVYGDFRPQLGTYEARESDGTQVQWVPTARLVAALGEIGEKIESELKESSFEDESLRSDYEAANGRIYAFLEAIYINLAEEEHRNSGTYVIEAEFAGRQKTLLATVRALGRLGFAARGIETRLQALEAALALSPDSRPRVGVIRPVFNGSDLNVDDYESFVEQLKRAARAAHQNIGSAMQHSRNTSVQPSAAG